MRRHATLLAGCAILAMSAGSAYADCAAELEALETGAGDAAVEVESGTGTQAGDSPAAESESAEAAEGAETAASEEATAEVEAEAGTQSGESVKSTEAAEAEQAEDETTRMAAIERAKAALTAGDEEGCMDALEEARS